jgi:hypothetical protein
MSALNQHGDEWNRGVQHSKENLFLSVCSDMRRYITVYDIHLYFSL